MEFFKHDTKYKLVRIQNIDINKIKPHYSMWISYYLYKISSKLCKYDWGSLISTLERGYNPQYYNYIVLDEKDNYLIDGNHRLFLLRLNKTKNPRIFVKVVKEF